MPKTNEPTIEHPVVKSIRQMKTKFSALTEHFGLLAAGAPNIEGGEAAKAFFNQASTGVGKMLTQLETQGGTLAGDAQKEFQNIWDIVDPNGMIDTFNGLLTGVNESTAMTFLQFFHEIKKIIRILWRLAFQNDADEQVLLLIDELVADGLKAMFPKKADDIHQEELRYQKEITAATHRLT